MAKRGQGEGSISRRPDGTWWARITIGKDENGRQQRKAFYGKTRKEVQEKLKVALSGGELGGSSRPPSMTLEQWCRKWLHDYNRLVVRPSTYMTNYGYFEKHIIPAMGGYPLKELGTSTIQDFINDKVTEGKLAPQSIHKIVWSLRSCLEQALKSGLISKNPIVGTVLPKKKETRRKCFTRDEQKRFIAVAKDTPLGEIFILILATGLRMGEALALTWADIDFKKELLTVNKTQATYKDPDNPKGKVVTTTNEPKTKSSNRSIPLLPAISKMLTQIKEDRRELLSEFGADLPVFCGEKGQMLCQTTVRNCFQKIAAQAGITAHYTPHCLRHTFATRGLENGIAMKVMQELLGHSSIRMTADLYTHVLPDTKMDAISLLEQDYDEDEKEAG